MLFGIDSLYFWLAVIIISIAAEAATLGLCGIWFAAGGAAALVGPSIATAEGGMGGTYIRTIGQTGTASLTVAAPQCEPVTVTFSVTGKENTAWN